MQRPRPTVARDLKVGPEALPANERRLARPDRGQAMNPAARTVRTTHGDLVDLTEWSVESRYPGDWPEHIDADTLRALSKAHAVCNSIAAEFSRRDRLARSQHGMSRNRRSRARAPLSP